jgi:hypothetical protein
MLRAAPLAAAAAPVHHRQLQHKVVFKAGLTARCRHVAPRIHGLQSEGPLLRCVATRAVRASEAVDNGALDTAAISMIADVSRVVDEELTKGVSANVAAGAQPSDPPASPLRSRLLASIATVSAGLLEREVEVSLGENWARSTMGESNQQSSARPALPASCLSLAGAAHAAGCAVWRASAAVGPTRCGICFISINTRAVLQQCCTHAPVPPLLTHWRRYRQV